MRLPRSIRMKFFLIGLTAAVGLWLFVLGINAALPAVAGAPSITIAEALAGIAVAITLFGGGGYLMGLLEDRNSRN